MSADAGKVAPESLALRAPPRPVTRLNRRAIAVLVGGTGLLIVLAMMWALQPKRARKTDSTPELHAAQSVPKAEGLQALPRDYASLPKVPQLGPPAGELGRPIVRTEREAGINATTDGSDFRPNAEVDAERVSRIRLQEEAEAANKAQVFFQTGRQRTEARSESGTGQAVAPTVDSTISGATAPASRAAPEASADQNQQDHKRAFVSQDADRDIYAKASLQVPRSPYELMVGTIIPAALVTGINSDLPGQIIATVTESVYDSATGRYLLIPQGARLLGQYDSQVAYGQRRVLLVWTRLILPDGSSIVLERLPGVDAAGYSGLEDGVDWHWHRILAGAALSTLLGVNAQLATQNQTTSSGSVIVATRESAQDTANQVGQQITRKNLDLQPTLTVRPGFPLLVIVNKDLILRPYQSEAVSEVQP